MYHINQVREIKYTGGSSSIHRCLFFLTLFVMLTTGRRQFVSLLRMRMLIDKKILTAQPLIASTNFCQCICVRELLDDSYVKIHGSRVNGCSRCINEFYFYRIGGTYPCIGNYEAVRQCLLG
jgi:hypothetical protein